MNPFHPVVGQPVGEFDVLQAQVVGIFEPPGAFFVVHVDVSDRETGIEGILAGILLGPTVGDVAQQVAAARSLREGQHAFAAEHGVHMGGTLEHGREREVLPAHREAEAVHDLGYAAPADGHLVVFVDLAVAVYVLVLDVAGTGVAGLHGRCRDLPVALEQPERHQTEALPDLVTDGVLPRIDDRAVIFEYLVAVERVVAHQAQRPIPPPLLKLLTIQTQTRS